MGGVERAGYGLIETIRVRDGRIPFLDRHLARLARSLAELGLPKPNQDIAKLVTPFAATGDAVLRVEVRDGRASVTVRELSRTEPPVVVTAAEPHQTYRHKTTERDCFEEAAAEAEVAEADDALLLTPEGFVAEGTTWTVYWWEGREGGGGGGRLWGGGGGGGGGGGPAGHANARAGDPARHRAGSRARAGAAGGAGALSARGAHRTERVSHQRGAWRRTACLPGRHGGPGRRPHRRTGSALLAVALPQ